MNSDIHWFLERINKLGLWFRMLIAAIIGSILPKRGVLLVGEENFPNVKLIFLELKRRNIPVEMYNVDKDDDVFKIIKAKVVVHTHFHFKFKPLGQKWIYIDHGCPFKATGNLERKPTSLKKLADIYQARLMNYHICESPLTQIIIAYEYGLPINKVKITGRPYVDYLLGNSVMDEVTKKELMKKLGLKDCENVILYVPTWRKSSGILEKVVKSFVSQVCEVEDLGNTCFIVKLHRNIPKEFFSLEGFPHIFLIWDKDLKSYGLSIYDLMMVSNVLITDYSSLALQWWVLDRPLLHYVPDLEEYTSQVGFALEPLESWLGGPIVREGNLLLAIEKVLKQDIWKEKRKILREIYYSFIDTNNTKRIVDIIEGIL